MVSVDITCDLMDEDESGFVWTFLREARDPGLIEPGAIVVVGDEDAPAVAEVVEIVEKPAGLVVHLRLLPGAIEGLRSACPSSHSSGLTSGPARQARHRCRLARYDIVHRWVIMVHDDCYGVLDEAPRQRSRRA